ncbi:hypothetical protein M2451_000222 [Dysgonomonas sp. PFB1-18]|nr:hypothetical protein [Dysgonomonas sp. PF1-14]MDH6337691.1 hypothetical protein [Dysgonomonas sp. PF1-16]MDH6378915.1 hypothetical protein [Dysgonomonas sp. PFB1-18]MDH6396550.1 hypothetical protein [Dysgonomonas sp. PF1-23]
MQSRLGLYLDINLLLLKREKMYLVYILQKLYCNVKFKRIAEGEKWNYIHKKQMYFIEYFMILLQKDSLYYL